MEILVTPSQNSIITPLAYPSRKDYDKSPVPFKNGAKFYLLFAALCICLLLSSLELSVVSTAITTISNDLHASDHTWIGSAYALSSTACLPMSGGLAQAFGRRPAILISIVLFALGSGICGAANGMNMLIAGRTIQGFGGGGIQSLTAIILADLVTLQKRGVYASLYSLIWCIATSIGPAIGGSFVTKGQWRWLFYLDLPISLVAYVSVAVLLDLPNPPGNFHEKIMQMDWIGNFLVTASTVAYSIGLTWAGVTSAWDSAMVLVPLILGLVGLVIFIVYEATLAKHPLVPFGLMTNVTSVSGYIQTFCSYVVISAVVYYLPAYFMACKGTSSVIAGVYSLGFASLAPAAIITGYSMKITGRYRPQAWMGWVLLTITLGMMSTISANDSLGKFIGYVVPLGLGVGMLTGTSLYPIQAPLPVTLSAQSLALMWFIRSFASVWGIAIGSIVLQNELTRRLPMSFVEVTPKKTAIIYALILELPTLPWKTRSQVEIASVDSLAALWRVLVAISAAGLVGSFFMRGLPLHNRVDPDWALKNKEVQSTHGHSQNSGNTLNESIDVA